jgi:hypothetical protein
VSDTVDPIELDGTVLPGRLYLRGGLWWHAYQGTRKTTKKKDLLAAKFEVRNRFMSDERSQRAMVMRKLLGTIWNTELTRDHGWVYFFACGDLIKIGRSKRPLRRLSVIRSSSAHDVVALGVVVGGEIIEAAIHDEFAHLRDHGEWFRRGPEIDRFLADFSDDIELELTMGCGAKAS